MTVSDLAARGPGEAWATGYEQAADGLRPLLYRWDGTAWSRDTTLPGAGELGWLGKVQFVGEEVWIFHNRAGAGEILRRSAGGWSAVPLPHTLWTYQDFTAVPGAAWVVTAPGRAGEAQTSRQDPRRGEQAIATLKTWKILVKLRCCPRRAIGQGPGSGSGRRRSAIPALWTADSCSRSSGLPSNSRRAARRRAHTPFAIPSAAGR